MHRNSAEQETVVHYIFRYFRQHHEKLSLQGCDPDWIQGDRQMTASSLALEGMANTKEGAVLTAAVEAVTWKHCFEPDEGPRKGQRVAIYPKEMTQLELVLSTGDPSIDNVDGHPIAYAHLLQAAQSYEHPPIFLKEDSEQITSNEETATKVPMWMNIAAQVATGNRRMVLEDGPDKMNSDDDDALEEEHGDKLAGMHTPEMDRRKDRYGFPNMKRLDKERQPRQ
jgi:hypothetical protein